MALKLPNRLDPAAGLAGELARLASGPLLIGLDFDGTLTPIVDRPQDARLDAPMRRRLTTLAGLVPTAVISGRDLDDLQPRVQVPGAILVGSHGIEVAYPGDGVERAPGLEESDAALGPLVQRLRRETADLDGVLIEPKRHSVAVHWRLAGPTEEASAETVVERAAAAFPAFSIVRGKMVAEFRPAIDRHKGSAIRTLRERVAAGGTAPAILYVGDDVTDEDAFGALDGADDAGVLVASPARPSRAAWCLPDVAAVAVFLDRLIEARRPHSMMQQETRSSPR